MKNNPDYFPHLNGQALKSIALGWVGALMRFADDWKEYFDPSWPFHKEINVTEAFERNGLITSVCNDNGVFKYDLTEIGESFFNHLKNLFDIFTHEGVQPLENRKNAAKLLIEMCNDIKKYNFHLVMKISFCRH